MSGEVVISYRRKPDLELADRLKAKLERRLGNGSVFLDLDDVREGGNFERRLSEAVARSYALVVLISDSWIHRLTESLTGEDLDYVAFEVSEALDHGKHVVPVLVDNAEMPRPSELPDAMKGLSAIDAVHINRLTLNDDDVLRLVAALKQSPRAYERFMAWFAESGPWCIAIIVAAWFVLFVLADWYDKVANALAVPYDVRLVPVVIVPLLALLVTFRYPWVFPRGGLNRPARPIPLVWKLLYVVWVVCVVLSACTKYSGS